MLIDESLRKAATFLVQERADDETQEVIKRPVATAFFVGVNLQPNSLAEIYAVTARHVINKSRPHGKLHLRINTLDGEYQDISTPHEDWILHSSTDVAVIPILLKLPPSPDIKVIPMGMIATDEFVREKRVGVGDDVFFIGLFSEFPGKERVRPIIRFGNISLMPEEPIAVELEPGSSKRPIPAYLVESHSWGGHSGSPVFIHFPVYREPGVIQLPEWPLKEPLFHLLGLVHGHFGIKTDVKFTGDVLGSGKVDINAGIAIIVPAQFITELIMSEELVEAREKMVQQTQVELNQATDVHKDK